MHDQQKTAATETYSAGFRARYTGKAPIIHGGQFYEIEMLEGPDKGKLKVITRPPA